MRKSIPQPVPHYWSLGWPQDPQNQHNSNCIWWEARCHEANELAMTVRTSDFLNRKTTQTILHAFDYAKYVDRPLNTDVTLRLGCIETDHGHPAFDRIRHKCYCWLQRKQKQLHGHAEPPYYVFVFENPDGSDLHLHWVLHVPEELQKEFRRKLPGWVRKVLGTIPAPGDVYAQAVNPYEDKTLAKYILKGTDPEYIDHFHLRDYAAPEGELIPQGAVSGRRAGASVALNRAVRKGAGFVACQHRHEWKKRPWAGQLKHRRRRSVRSTPTVRMPTAPALPDTSPGLPVCG